MSTRLGLNSQRSGCTINSFLLPGRHSNLAGRLFAFITQWHSCDCAVSYCLQYVLPCAYALFPCYASFMPVLFAMGVFDSRKTRLIRRIHPSVFIHTSNCMSASLLWRGEQQTHFCSQYMRASRGLFWKRSVGAPARLRTQERDREVEKWRGWNSLFQRWYLCQGWKEKQTGLLKYLPLRAHRLLLRYESGGSTPHDTVVKRNIPVQSKY